MGFTFKELMLRDVSRVFMNANEHAEMHNIDGKQMSVIIDDNENIEREKKFKIISDGVYVKQALIYVSATDYGALPASGKLLKLDGKTYRVTDAINEDGLYSITMEANRS